MRLLYISVILSIFISTFSFHGNVVSEEEQSETQEETAKKQKYEKMQKAVKNIREITEKIKHKKTPYDKEDVKTKLNLLVKNKLMRGMPSSYLLVKNQAPKGAKKDLKAQPLHMEGVINLPISISRGALRKTYGNEVKLSVMGNKLSKKGYLVISSNYPYRQILSSLKEVATSDEEFKGRRSIFESRYKLQSAQYILERHILILKKLMLKLEISNACTFFCNPYVKEYCEVSSLLSWQKNENRTFWNTTCEGILLLEGRLKAKLKELMNTKPYEKTTLTKEEIESLGKEVDSMVSKANVLIQNRQARKVGMLAERANLLCEFLVEVARPRWETWYYALPNKIRMGIYQGIIKGLENLKQEGIKFCTPYRHSSPREITQVIAENKFNYMESKGEELSQSQGKLDKENLKHIYRLVFVDAINPERFTGCYFEGDAYRCLRDIKDYAEASISGNKDALESFAREYKIPAYEGEVKEALVYYGCLSAVQSDLTLKDVFNQLGIGFDTQTGEIRDISKFVRIFDGEKFSQLRKNFEDAMIKFMEKLASQLGISIEVTYAPCASDFNAMMDPLGRKITTDYEFFSPDMIRRFLTTLSNTNDEIYKAYSQFKEFYENTISNKKNNYLKLLKILSQEETKGNNSPKYYCVKYLSAFIRSHLFFLTHKYLWDNFIKEEQLAGKYENKIAGFSLSAPIFDLVRDFGDVLRAAYPLIKEFVKDELKFMGVVVPPGPLGLYLKIKNNEISDSYEKRESLEKIREFLHSFGILIKLFQFYANAFTCFKSEKGKNFYEMLKNLLELGYWKERERNTDINVPEVFMTIQLLSSRNKEQSEALYNDIKFSLIYIHNQSTEAGIWKIISPIGLIRLLTVEDEYGKAINPERVERIAGGLQLSFRKPCKGKAIVINNSLKSEVLGTYINKNEISLYDMLKETMEKPDEDELTKILFMNTLPTYFAQSKTSSDIFNFVKFVDDLNKGKIILRFIPKDIIDDTVEFDKFGFKLNFLDVLKKKVDLEIDVLYRNALEREKFCNAFLKHYDIPQYTK